MSEKANNTPTGRSSRRKRTPSTNTSFPSCGFFSREEDMYTPFSFFSANMPDVNAGANSALCDRNTRPSNSTMPKNWNALCCVCTRKKRLMRAESSQGEKFSAARATERSVCKSANIRRSKSSAASSPADATCLFKSNSSTLPTYRQYKVTPAAIIIAPNSTHTNKDRKERR